MLCKWSVHRGSRLSLQRLPLRPHRQPHSESRDRLLALLGEGVLQLCLVHLLVLLRHLLMIRRLQLLIRRGHRARRVEGRSRG